MYDELVKTLRLRAALWEKMYDEDNVLKQAADAIEEMSRKYIEERNAAVELTGELASKPRWIPVTERLPEEKTPVQVTYLGYNDKKPRTDMIACLYYGYWCYWDGAPCSYNKCKVEVTHWMPLQPAPKEE